MDLNIRDRAFFISGGSKGIGKSLTLFLLEEGACVATCARTNRGLEDLLDTVPAEKQHNLITFPGDVLDAKRTETILRETIRKFGRLDGIVANAGFGTTGTVLETPKGEWIAQYEMKLFSILHIVKPAVAALKQSDAGRIVILNGVTADKPDHHMPAVSAARAAVKQVHHMLAKSLAPDILVNSVNIGAITTDRQKDRYKKSETTLSYADWETEEAKRRGILLKRYGRPEEVVPFIGLFLSPLSSYITAGSVEISGGMGGHRK